MLILLTTANFPDVMLPAYKKSYWNILFFGSFLVLGLYLMLNFLLANVFMKFSERLKKEADMIFKEMEFHLNELFSKHDLRNTGWLTKSEANTFFASFLGLNEEKQKDKDLLERILKIVAHAEHEHKFYRKDMLDFFLR